METNYGLDCITAPYENCISLGYYCGVASSMSRYGLLGKSGPFDWFYSDLESVLRLMEIDFYDFMAKENLYIDVNDPLKFRDKKTVFIVLMIFSMILQKNMIKYIRSICVEQNAFCRT